MNLKEKTISTKKIYQGKKLSLIVNKVIMPNGKEIEKELIMRAKNSVIIALNQKNEVIMERQFRHPFNDIIEALPAGKADDNESFIETAKREFQEETGYLADTWMSLGQIYPCPAYSNEIVEIFLAKNLTMTKTKFDDDEFLEIYTLPLVDFYTQCLNGTIKDARTIIAAFRLKNYLENKK